MNTPNDGGPAFPQQPEYDVNSGTFQKIASGQKGMSLRDWFAGMALAHWANIPWTNELYEKVGGTFHTQAARWCYECADAMLAESHKHSTEPKP